MSAMALGLVLGAVFAVFAVGVGVPIGLGIYVLTTEGE